MWKNYMTVLLVVILVMIPGLASADWQGIDAWSGEDWQALQPESKPPFLLGMIEGLKFRGPELGPWEPATEDVEEYIPEIDLVYENLNNVNLPIVLILDYVNSKFAGMDQTELDFRLKDLRRIGLIN